MSLPVSLKAEKRKKFLVGLAALVLITLIALGAMAKNGWLPSTDPMTGKKTGWFGSESSPPFKGGVDALRGRGGSLDPAAPLPVPTPQLSKEYIYAGSRLLAVEDTNANAAPPADLAIWRPGTGVWYVLGGPGSAYTVTGWGQSGDDPVEGDYDGDGKTDFSVFRPSTGQWYVMNSSDGSWSIWTWGVSTDITAPADYDGDGKTDRAIFRPSTGTWYIVRSFDGSTITPQFGQTGDAPAPADYDGDGKADLAVWKNSNSTFSSINSSNSIPQTITFTQSSTQPVSADYDGDGKADYAIRTGSSWIIRKSSTGQIDSPITPSWELSGDTAVQNDYDGDGKVDIATWRSNGQWYIRQSSLIGQTGELRNVGWGQQYDIPVPAFYRR